MMQLRTSSTFGRTLTLCIALALGACASFPPVHPPPGGAEGATRPADHAQAAARYEAQAASARPADQIEFGLAAAREWLAANRPADAARVLSGVRTAPGSAQAFEYTLLDAETALAGNHAPEAWQKLIAIAEPTTATNATRYQLLKMRIALADARATDAVRAEAAAERFASGASERDQLRLQLLAATRSARERGVRLDAQPLPDPIVRGWVDLGTIAAEARGASLAGEVDLARWRGNYPNHPAAEILPQAFPAPLLAAAPGKRVALLLPLTGPASVQAATVRDGFLSAYYQLPTANRPDLRVFDTAAVTPADAIAEARAAGASYIVGPLLREDVAAVADLGRESTPVLALNFLPSDQRSPEGLYQFALSPEEEAQLVARRLLADGHRRGVALVPRGEWGNRVIEAFARELTAGGGELLAQESYDSSAHDYSIELETVLRVSDSDARHQRLQSVLGTKLNFEPRHRGDIEFVFIVPQSATNARLLAPQLKYFYAGDIPSYSLSNAYDSDSLDANRDIDGLRYPDMPWMVSGDSAVDTIRGNIEQAWGTRAAWRTRLFAFGYDACQLMLALASAHDNPALVQVAGLTGQLHFDAAGRVERSLLWVQVRDGEPKRLAAADAAPDAPQPQ